MVEDYKGVHECALPTRQPQLVCWVAPRERAAKVNVDESSQGNPGLIGFGGLVNDAEGAWIRNFVRSIGIASNLVAEFLAMKHDLPLTWSLGIEE